MVGTLGGSLIEPMHDHDPLMIRNMIHVIIRTQNKLTSSLADPKIKTQNIHLLELAGWKMLSFEFDVLSFDVLLF